jgi:hypothetical protein
MNQYNYPNWICLPCGNRYGRKTCGIATWHPDNCDICGNEEMVTEPRDFGHLNDYWIDAYNIRVAIDKAFKDVPLYDKMDTVSPYTNTPAPAEEYRTLNDGEIVMDGDEFWGPDRIWIPSIEIGKKVTSYTHKMYRRPTVNKTDAEKEARITEWTAKIDSIVEAYLKLLVACDNAQEAGCLDIDGVFYTTIWASFDSLLEHIDQHEWIEWYIFENECGDAELESGFDGVLSIIQTSSDLAKLIIEDEDGMLSKLA